MNDQHVVNNLSDEVSLLDCWSIIWKNKWIVFSFATLIILLTGVKLYLTPKTYMAEASLLILDQRQSLLGSLGGIALPGGMGGGNSAAKLLVVFNSKSIAKQVVDDLKITEFLARSNQEQFHIRDYIPFIKVKNNNQPGTEKSRRRQNDLAIKYLQKTFTIANLKGGLVKINIEWPDPDMGAEIVNAYIQIVSMFMNDNSISINFKIIDPALPAIDRYSPKVKKSLILAAFASVVLSMLFIFLKEAFIVHKLKNNN